MNTQTMEFEPIKKQETIKNLLKSIKTYTWLWKKTGNNHYAQQAQNARIKLINLN